MTQSTEWIKSKRSGQKGRCVEMRRTPDTIEVRDSKDPDGPTLRFTPTEFVAWIDGARKGKFDHLT